MHLCSLFLSFCKFFSVLSKFYILCPIPMVFDSGKEIIKYHNTGLWVEEPQIGVSVEETLQQFPVQSCLPAAFSGHLCFGVRHSTSGNFAQLPWQAWNTYTWQQWVSQRQRCKEEISAVPQRLGKLIAYKPLTSCNVFLIVAKPLLLYGRQVVSPRRLQGPAVRGYGAAPITPEDGASGMADGNHRWMPVVGDCCCTHSTPPERPSPVAGGVQGSCWTSGCRQAPMQSDTGISPERSCIPLEVKWPSR